MSDFVTLATYDNYINASFHKQKLEDAGIMCYLGDENTVTMQWMLSNAVGGIKLRVLSDDVEEAIKILSTKAEQIPVDYTIENNDLICPRCRSNNTITEKYSKSIFAASWLFLGFPIKANPMKTSRCFYCGNIWTERAK